MRGRQAALPADSGGLHRWVCRRGQYRLPLCMATLQPTLATGRGAPRWRGACQWNPPRPLAHQPLPASPGLFCSAVLIDARRRQHYDLRLLHTLDVEVCNLRGAPLGWNAHGRNAPSAPPSIARLRLEMPQPGCNPTPPTAGLSGAIPAHDPQGQRAGHGAAQASQRAPAPRQRTPQPPPHVHGMLRARPGWRGAWLAASRPCGISRARPIGRVATVRCREWGLGSGVPPAAPQRDQRRPSGRDASLQQRVAVVAHAPSPRRLGHTAAAFAATPAHRPCLGGARPACCQATSSCVWADRPGCLLGGRAVAARPAPCVRLEEVCGRGVWLQCTGAAALQPVDQLLTPVYLSIPFTFWVWRMLLAASSILPC